MHELHRTALELIRSLGELHERILHPDLAAEMHAADLIERDVSVWKLTDLGMRRLDEAIPSGGWCTLDVAAGGTTQKTRGNLVLGRNIELTFPGRGRLVMSHHELVWIAVYAFQRGSQARDSIIKSVEAEIFRGLIEPARQAAEAAEAAAATIRASLARTEPGASGA